ncbi:MAG: energy transducer TonB [Bacteroidaceae bacterium]|nr:energy transducer TonB [Bacteroidaceae bacterium]
MKKVILLFGLLFFALNIQAQIATEKNNATDCVTTDEVFDFQVVDKKPKFPGGMTSLQSYINRSLKYPQVSRENNSQGRVIVRFIINNNGTVTSPQVVRSSGDFYLDMEAVRVIESMPKWKPGKHKGKPVRVFFTLPIVFKLQ